MFVWQRCALQISQTLVFKSTHWQLPMNIDEFDLLTPSIGCGLLLGPGRDTCAGLGSEQRCALSTWSLPSDPILMRGGALLKSLEVGADVIKASQSLDSDVERPILRRQTHRFQISSSMAISCDPLKAYRHTTSRKLLIIQTCLRAGRFFFCSCLGERP